MIYKCGCEALGDNVANCCPVHGEAASAENNACVIVPSAGGMSALVDCIAGQYFFTDRGVGKVD